MATHALSILAVALTALAGCATILGPVKQPSAGVDFEVATRDNPAARRFELTFVSRSKRDLCLLPEQWPNAAGKMDWAGGTVVVRVGATEYPLANWNGGFCPGGCLIARVRRGQSIAAFIPYGDFEGFGADQFEKPKELVFPPYATWCGRWADRFQ